MIVPLLRPQTLLAIGNALPASELFPFLTETVRAVPSLLDLSGLRGTRSQLASRLVAGPYAVSGNVLIEPSLDELSRLLPRILGGATTPNDPPGGTTCTLAETIPDFFVVVDRGANVFTYAGCKIVRAEMSARVGEPIRVALQIEGLTETIDEADSFPTLTYSPAPQLRFAAAEVNLLGIPREVKQLTWIVENRAILDRYVNSLTRVDLPIIDRKSQLRCVLDFDGDSADLYQNRAIVASASAVLAAGGRSLELDFQKLSLQVPSPAVAGAQELLLALDATAGAETANDELLAIYTN